MSIQINGSSDVISAGDGSFELNGATVIKTTTIQHTNGTQALVVNSDGSVTATKISGGGLTHETAVGAATTSVNFTGIPSWVKRITIIFDGVSTTGTSVPLIQLGDSGGIETTGYNSVSATFVSAANNSLSTSTVGFQVSQSANWTAAGIIYGSCVLSELSTTSNTWSIMGRVSRPVDTTQHSVSGTKTLSSTLDRIRITPTNGTDTFDAGTINIMYEG